MKTTDTSKRMKKEERRAQILDAAMAVFVEKGFNGSTTLEIAKAADVSEVTLFRYFSSKQEIFLSGIEPILLSTLKGSIDLSADLSAQAKLEYILFERICLISSHYKIVKLILSEGALLSALGGENFMSRIVQTLKSVLTGIGISMVDKEFALRILMGSILSFLYIPQKDEESIRRYARKVTALILSQADYKAQGGNHE